jgi:hypothetical protein
MSERRRSCFHSGHDQRTHNLDRHGRNDPSGRNLQRLVVLDSLHGADAPVLQFESRHLDARMEDNPLALEVINPGIKPGLNPLLFT